MDDLGEIAASGDATSWLPSSAASLESPTVRIACCGLFLVIGLFLLLPPRGRGRAYIMGTCFVTLGSVGFLLPTLAQLSGAFVFFFLEALAIIGGLGTISSRNPVYCAIWFASCLLSIGALMLLTGAQFLGLATVAVYAGAIVVTLLFVLMLAQPEGHAIYDRLGWGWLPTLFALIAGTSLVTLVTISLARRPDEAGSRFTHLDAVHAAIEQVNPNLEQPAAELVRQVRHTVDTAGNEVLVINCRPMGEWFPRQEAAVAQAVRQAVGETLSPTCQITFLEHDLFTDQHVARLGGILYGRYLISVQFAGVLLLAALVGAIAMAIHGKDLVRATAKGISP